MEKKEIEQLKNDIIQLVDSLDLETKRSTLGELETKSMEEDFWADRKTAQKISQQIEQLREDIETATQLQDDITALSELYNAAQHQDDKDLEEMFYRIKKQYEEFKIAKYLSGKYDRGAAILTIKSGQGGTDANDWAQMLLRMYTQFIQKKGWSYSIVNITKGAEAGITTATLEIHGKFAYGLLKGESGVHRLVRLSPFNSQNLRQTSFASVEVLPVIEETDDIKIDDNEIEFKAVRSGGPGGQHVNKTSSAVQIKHIPTGIVVHCSERRDQQQNRAKAMQILKSKLWQLKEQQRQKTLSKIKENFKVADWGNQSRNYILHPYKLVKDLRSGIESSNPQDVLDGNIEEFIEGNLR